jgi:hypothetical protein
MNAQSPLSRISKLFLDRDQEPPEAATARRKGFQVELLCGTDVARSATLQVAVLTAVRLARRCFGEKVSIVVAPDIDQAPSRVWRHRSTTIGETIRECADDVEFATTSSSKANAQIGFGADRLPAGSMRVTFDGWIACVGPAEKLSRLAEREFFPTTGVLAAALAVSEIFLKFAGLSVQATRRDVGLSLWRPDLPIKDPEAAGIEIGYLPSKLWALGLGHLGNGYLWAIATLPYASPSEVELSLNDHDVVEPENTETGILYELSDVGRFKTRVCSAWLREQGFSSRITERKFDENFRVRGDEPAVALCGFDNLPARRALDSAGFRYVFEAGVGGTYANFDSVSFHALPGPMRATELWTDPEETDRAADEAQLQSETERNPGYRLVADNACGRLLLAGKSVAVPFVGASAASLVIAEAVRLVNGGVAYPSVKISLSGLPQPSAVQAGATYSMSAASELGATEAEIGRASTY